MIIHPTTHLVICITTYMRPIGLGRLLSALRMLVIPAGHHLSYVVVDNDSSGSAEPLVESAREDGLGPIHYAVEPERGISQARNRALQEAADADWIAFLDDDDWPDPDWLRHLVAAQGSTGADVVIGRGDPHFETSPPGWMLDGHFFDRSHELTPGEISYWQAHTGGALIRQSTVADLGEAPFDPELGLVGGEDTAFFWDLTQRGARIVWTGDAVMHEGVPATRIRTRWLVARAFRIGNSRGTLLVSRIDPRWHRRILRIGRSGWSMASGAIRLVVARERAARVRSLQRIASGMGETFGVLGGHYHEYRRRVHGS